MPKLVSVNVGLPAEVPWRGKFVRTAIWKRPVEAGCLPAASTSSVINRRICTATPPSSSRHRSIVRSVSDVRFSRRSIKVRRHFVSKEYLNKIYRS